MELLVSAEADINRKKAQVIENLEDLHEDEKRGLLKNLDEKMKDLSKEMELA